MNPELSGQNAWAAHRGLLPSTNSRAGADSRKRSMVFVAQRAEPAGETATKPPESAKAPSKNWPELSPDERGKNLSRVGVPWWYPFQPVNRVDLLWERMFADRGRAARDRLLALFQELAALGKSVRGQSDPQKIDLDAIEARAANIQQAYDSYVQAKIELHTEWKRYLSMGYPIIGVHVLALVNKIDNELPDRIDGLASGHDAALRKAKHAGHQALEKARGRVEKAYTALVWTNRVVTVVELASFVGVAKAAAAKAFTRAIAKGIAHSEARRIAILEGITKVTVSLAVGNLVGLAIPKVLGAAGLDEADVQVGLTVFFASMTLLGLRSFDGRRVPPKKPVPDKPRRPARGLTERDRAMRLDRMVANQRAGRAFNKAREKFYPYNEVRVQDKDGLGYHVLDSYDPVKEEIVFRRLTQFSENTPDTNKRYLKEFSDKYPPGVKILNGPLTGHRLRGRMFFEVPVQWKRIPRKVLDDARARNIIIRDTRGRVYD